MFWGDTSRCTIPCRAPESSRLSWVALSPARIPVAIAIAIEVGIAAPDCLAWRRSTFSGTPCTYSCTSITSRPLATTSRTGTTLW